MHSQLAWTKWATFWTWYFRHTSLKEWNFLYDLDCALVNSLSCHYQDCARQWPDVNYSTSHYLQHLWPNARTKMRDTRTQCGKISEYWSFTPDCDHFCYYCSSWNSYAVQHDNCPAFINQNKMPNMAFKIFKHAICHFALILFLLYVQYLPTFTCG